MRKYEPLQVFLSGQTATAIPITFAEIERILESALPRSARTHRAWWSNNAANNVMTKEWLAAGYETESVDIAGERLVFKRVATHKSTLQVDRAAKQNRRHPLFGCMKNSLKIAEGFDVSQPPDEEWNMPYLGVESSDAA